MPTKVNVGLRIPATQPDSPKAILDFVRHAEALGFHSIWVGDHVFYHMDVPAAFTHLTWIAGVTSRVRLGTSVMLSSYLNPVMLAKSAATLDWLSGGRLTLGMSIGGTPDEYASIGVPMDQRLGRFLETVTIMRKLWTEGDDVNFEGRYTTITHGNVRPKPAQPGGVPIFFGAASEAMMRRLARRADGWCCASGPNIAQFLSRIQTIRGYATEAGRNPDELGFVKQHNISIAADHATAEKAALAHWGRYYGPRFNVESTTRGTPSQVADELLGFQATTDVAEVTLALEPATLDIGLLEAVWRATEGIR